MTTLSTTDRLIAAITAATEKTNLIDAIGGVMGGKALDEAELTTFKTALVEANLANVTASRVMLLVSNATKISDAKALVDTMFGEGAPKRKGNATNATYKALGFFSVGIKDELVPEKMAEAFPELDAKDAAMKAGITALSTAIDKLTEAGVDVSMLNQFKLTLAQQK